MVIPISVLFIFKSPESLVEFMNTILSQWRDSFLHDYHEDHIYTLTLLLGHGLITEHLHLPPRFVSTSVFVSKFLFTGGNV